MTMDFDKIKPAAEEISLDDIQKERILAACRNAKRKKFNYKLWIPVAAAAVFAVVLVSPGFIFRAKSSDAAENLNKSPLADQKIEFYADDQELFDMESGNGNADLHYSTSFSPSTLFNRSGYRRIYAIVPKQFTWLVDADEYRLWESRVKASGGMAMMQFVEHFNISEEDFDAANEAYAAYLDSCYIDGHLDGIPETVQEEKREIFNTDIIYTFDREKIDEYYSAIYQ